MGVLTNIFYLISTSLLIPVMLVLLWCLVRVLVLAGSVLREYSDRTATRRELAAVSQSLQRGDVATEQLQPRTLVADALNRLFPLSGDEVLVEKVIQDCGFRWQSDVEKLRSLARLGPALGLMGTLIPLGPALVGLAAGDLQMMAQNLMIAFATTVVGLLIGTLATTLAGIRKRWYQADHALVVFAANRMFQLRGQSVNGHESVRRPRSLCPDGDDPSTRPVTAISSRIKETSHV